MTFTAAEPDAPLYFLSSDGIRTEMYYQGGVMKVTLTIPQAAVDSDFQYLVPTLNFVKYEKDESGEHRTDHRIDWYEKLTPDHPVSSAISPCSPLDATFALTKCPSSVSGSFACATTIISSSSAVR